MKKHLCYLLAISTVFVFSGAFAQNDSSYFDLGRIKLQKDFTQHVTIKGSELERMPFARVSDAVAPWLHGTLSTKRKLVFVVDGNLVNDVDAWSIHDIEEITLIQNALASVNGSLTNQQLVLVTTKRDLRSKKGITVAGSSYLTSMDYLKANDDFKSENNFYHQYHVSAWQNLGRISFGASANWLRDVFPLTKDLFDTQKPRQLNRFRFNGWMDATLAAGHTLTLRMNVTPQTISHDVTNLSVLYVQNEVHKSKHTVINPSLHLSNRISEEWSHELDLSFLTNRGPSDTRSVTDYLPPASGNFEVVNHASFKNRIFLLRDRISYTKKLGQWQIQPSLNFSYRSSKQEGEFSSATFNNGMLSSNAGGWSTLKGESWVLTPAFNLSYRNAFSIGGGVAAKLKEDNTVLEDRIYPFVTTMLDLLRIGRPDNPNSLKLFGSFSMPGDFMDNSFKQSDLTPDSDPLLTNTPGAVFGGTVLYSPYPADPTVRHFEAGAVFALPEDKLQVSYNFDNRRYLGQFLRLLPGGTGYDWLMTYPDYVYSTHRLAVLTRVINKGGLRWLSGINTTALKYKIKDEEDFPTWRHSMDANNDRMIWTGGWTNRLQYKNFSFGLDLIYHFNDQRIIAPGDEYKQFNTFRLNNIYAGYSFKIAKSKPLEVYLNSRNCWQNDESNFADNRRYYGAGFKLQL